MFFEGMAEIHKTEVHDSLGPCLCFPATRLSVQSMSTNKAKQMVKMCASKLAYIIRVSRLFPAFNRDYSNR